MIYKHVKHLFRATKYTFAGLKAATAEIAFRQELMLVIPHAILIWLLKIDFITALILSMLWFMILAAELINTSIEAVVNMTSPEIHPLAKIAKDTASAAVGCLIFAFFAAWTGAIIFS